MFRVLLTCFLVSGIVAWSSSLSKRQLETVDTTYFQPLAIENCHGEWGGEKKQLSDATAAPPIHAGCDQGTTGRSKQVRNRRSRQTQFASAHGHSEHSKLLFNFLLCTPSELPILTFWKYSPLECALFILPQLGVQFHPSYRYVSLPKKRIFLRQAKSWKTAT